MLLALAGLVGIMMAASPAPSIAQKATGRSATGPLTLSLSDSAVASALRKNRVVNYDMEFTEPSGNNHLEPRETGRLRVVLTNSGKVTIRNLVVKVIPLAAPQEVTYNDSIVVGDLPVNTTRYAIFYFVAGERVQSQVVTFQINVHDTQGDVADPRLFTFLTRGR
jgi:hypothetical protein